MQTKPMACESPGAPCESPSERVRDQSTIINNVHDDHMTYMSHRVVLVVVGFALVFVVISTCAAAHTRE